MLSALNDEPSAPAPGTDLKSLRSNVQAFAPFHHREGIEGYRGRFEAEQYCDGAKPQNYVLQRAK